MFYKKKMFFLYFLIISLYLFINCNSLNVTEAISQFQNRSNELRHRLKSGVRIKYEGPSDDVRYSPIRQLEYPGKDADKISKLIDLWNDYYSCLETQYASIGKHRRIPPIAVLVLENHNVHLECDLCQSPEQANNQITWYRLDSPYGKPILVIESENIIISQDDKLSIYRAQRENAGIYYCQIGDTRTNPYYLHIFGENEQLSEVKRSTAPKGPYALENEKLNYDLELKTTWSSWSECSRCGKVGKKKRFGSCTVIANINENYTERRLTEELKIGIDSKKEGYLGFLLLFRQGLPCRSRLLPLWIRKQNELNRSNELMTAFCKVKCNDVVFEVKDKFGKIIETVNNSAGIYSTLQGPPHLIPMVSRATYYCMQNQPFILLCPGTLYTDAPIEWYINKTIRIIPWFVDQNSKGRVNIDSRERLVFKSIQEEDAKMYSCWQRGQIAAIVRLVVYDSTTISIDHHMILLGTITILSVFIYLFFRIYLNKTKASILYFESFFTSLIFVNINIMIFIYESLR